MRAQRAAPCGCHVQRVTASGVSTANVVATIEVPASHHGAPRPERNSPTLFRAAAGEPQPDPEVDREEQDDDRDVQRAERHGGSFVRPGEPLRT